MITHYSFSKALAKMKKTAIFVRQSPSQFAQKTGIPMGWFVLPHRLVPDIRQRRRLHGSWCTIKSDKGAVYRILRFSPRLKGGKVGGDSEVVLDWAAWIELNGRDEAADMPMELTVSKARFYQYPFLALRHQDPSYRLASGIAMVSLLLGAVSVALGVWSVLLALGIY